MREGKSLIKWNCNRELLSGCADGCKCVCCREKRMNSMKNILRTLRKAKGVTQEEMACALNVSAQAVSKWENGAAQPDIQLLPKIAEYFSVSIYELFGYKLDALTDKEKFIRYMENNQILQYGEFELKHAGMQLEFAQRQQIVGGAGAHCGLY